MNREEGISPVDALAHFAAAREAFRAGFIHLDAAEELYRAKALMKLRFSAIPGGREGFRHTPPVLTTDADGDSVMDDDNMHASGSRRKRRTLFAEDDRLGRLTVLCPLDAEHTAYLCRCDCGKQRPVSRAGLMRGTQSCGCLNREAIKAFAVRPRTHGLSKSSEYITWLSMHARCNNAKHISWKWYGARGIEVCERWSSFERFYEDMGPKPTPNHTLERKKGLLPYFPENCTWATKVEQARNRRTCRMLTIFGRTKTATEWAELAGLNPDLFFTRLRLGQTPQEALRPSQGRSRLPGGRTRVPGSFDELCAQSGTTVGNTLE